MNWIDELLEETSDAESPKAYFYWSSLAAVSAICSPNVYIDRYLYKLSPNLYIFLIGESGIRKGPPINLAHDLVEAVDCTRVIKGRFTIQGLIRELAKSHSNNQGKLLSDSRAFVAVGEFASSLIYDPSGIAILTDLYDTYYNKTWSNTLANSPIAKLIKPCVTFLAASNESNFEDSLPKEAIRGGFIARCIIVHQTKRRTVNSLIYKPKNTLNHEKLGEYLTLLKDLKGEIVVDDIARRYYDDWYKSFTTVNYNDKTGTMNRIPDTILKVATLIHLSREPTLIINLKDMEEAIQVCLDCVSGMKRVTVAQGSSEFAEKTRRVLGNLMKSFPEGEKRSKILRSNWGDLDSVDLDRIISNLEQSQAIEICKVPGDILYKIKPNIYEQYVKFSEKKGKVI